ncbi:hypothetical protein [Streptomyces ureilyticus]|uniref:Colicin D immunity protein domain-containing protein n=1 Tax=Streptomyces ureilyticus TaxID=1775131 RepID=A0ABX0DP71_9ACTN|nr:hypothetical protein [Streptomyces ureilyticus]NGO40982.1 hypothetical protein [Streptomyces ureilyticus]
MRIRDAVRWRSARGDADFEGRVSSELAVDLPDEDLGEYLYDCIDLYEMGSKPRCEEVEYLELVQEAIERVERGR